MSNTLQPHGLQHARLFCPPCPGICSDSCPLSQWCYLIISYSTTPFLLLLSIFPSIRIFSSDLALCIRWRKYWSFSFSISPSNEYLELISFRIDWFDIPCCPRDSQGSALAPQLKTINSSVLFMFLMFPFSHSYMTTGKNHSFD